MKHYGLLSALNLEWPSDNPRTCWRFPCEPIPPSPQAPLKMWASCNDSSLQGQMVLLAFAEKITAWAHIASAQWQGLAYSRLGNRQQMGSVIKTPVPWVVEQVLFGSSLLLETTEVTNEDLLNLEIAQVCRAKEWKWEIKFPEPRQEEAVPSTKKHEWEQPNFPQHRKNPGLRWDWGLQYALLEALKKSDNASPGPFGITIPRSANTRGEK